MKGNQNWEHTIQVITWKRLLLRSILHYITISGNVLKSDDVYVQGHSVGSGVGERGQTKVGEGWVEEQNYDFNPHTPFWQKLRKRWSLFWKLPNFSSRDPHFPVQFKSRHLTSGPHPKLPPPQQSGQLLKLPQTFRSTSKDPPPSNLKHTGPLITPPQTHFPVNSYTCHIYHTYNYLHLICEICTFSSFVKFSLERE